MSLQVEPSPARLSVSSSPRVTVYQGERARFTVRIGRSNFDDPVLVHFAAGPPAIDLPDITMERGETLKTVEIAARADQAAGTWKTRVEARSLERGGPADDSNRIEIVVLPKIVPRADILFVLDLTGSMGFAIKGIRDGIQRFAAQLATEKLDARIGLIGFRDIVDDNQRPFALSVNGQTFTKDYDTFRTLVGRLKAYGGGDEPESSLQALALASEQPFRRDAARVLLLITDAPPKIHPGETPSTIDETIAVLKSHRINQLHFIVRPVDYNRSFGRFHGETQRIEI